MAFQKTGLSLALSLSLMCAAVSGQAQTTATLLDTTCNANLEQPLTEPGTGRTWVLDYPCDLRADESVTLILNLHGGGSNTAYQRAYFPAWELKEKHRLVMATPYSPVARWREEDDEYLQNIVSAMIESVGADRVRAFWLVGHSQGGFTSRRLVCTDFFRDKVDGLVSLSGGRLGGATTRSPNAGRPRQADAPPPSTPAQGSTSSATVLPEPDCDFSHIYTTGEYEISDLPQTSLLAQRFQCEARVRRPDVVDTEAGKTYDSRSQNPGTREWGLLPRPGTAQVFEYPNCADGRVVADVVRIDKGHTEGLEPNVMDTIVTLMVSASGGKIRGD